MANPDKRLRAIGATLNPAATIGDKGNSESLLREVDSRLRDHELIKVRSQIRDRDTNRKLFTELAEQLDARLVQITGRTALMLRYAENETPAASNLQGETL